MSFKQWNNENVLDSDINSVSTGAFIGAKTSSLNLIRQLQDRSVDFSADGGEWAEAYVDSNGQKNSVDTTLNTALYDASTLVYGTGYDTDLSADTTDNTGSIASEDNFFDDDGATSATGSSSSTGYTSSLGKIFSARSIDSVFVSISITLSGSAGTVSGTAKLQTYDGTTWNDISTLITVSGNGTYNYNGYSSIGSSVQGIRVIMATSTSIAENHSHSYTIMDYGTLAESIITHDILTGTFSSTISSSFGTALVADWESGANIQYKLSNALDGGSINDSTVYSTGGTNYSLMTTYLLKGTNISIDVDLKTNGSTGICKSLVRFNYFDGTSSDVTYDSTSNGVYETHTYTNPSPLKYILSIDLYLAATNYTANVTNIIGTISPVAGVETGWLNYNEVSTFTAFTSEPTQCIVKLIPKTSSPTAGYPSIKGFSILE